MKSLLALIFLALIATDLYADLVEDAPKDCAYCEEWNNPQEPFRIYGNTWYVGTEGLGSVLVVTDAGLILIDGALAQSAPLIVENIRQIGFDPLEIKYILNSHAHYDHAGGIAALQKYTGTQVLASEGSVAVLRSGELADSDPQFNFGVEANRFPPIGNVGLFGNGESLTLGDTTLTAHYTPGHTPGGTTWTWQSCEDSTCLNMVYADSLSAVSAEGFLFSNPDLSPNNAQQILTSTSLIRELPCDVLMAPHPFLIKMEEKLAARAVNPDINPFIDPAACAAYADYFDAWLARRLEEENAVH
ncbi:subclass B3 metallo-beta-lactamase [Pseudomonadota bacterium]